MATNASGDETESDAEYYEISIQETNSGTLVVKAESSDEAWEALEDPDAETRDKMRDAIERDGMPPQPVDRRRAHEFEGNDEYLADVDVTE